jgi:heme O synthase-like polyprenyltransferase
MVLVPISLIPALTGKAGLVYSLGSFSLGLNLAHYNGRFAFRRSNVTARHFLTASIFYLPAVFFLSMMDMKCHD